MALHEPKPYPKSVALARGERRFRRKVASPKQWQAIAAAKQGPCRVCGGPPPNELHHLVARAHGGGDVPDNIVPLCSRDHGLVTRRDAVASRSLLESLTDAEYAYCIEKAGEGVWERMYGLRYLRA